MNKPAKILISLFLAVFLLQLAGLVFLLAAPQAAHAINLQVALPDNPQTIGEYIRAIYNFAVGAVGILAAVVMMYGGLLWLMAGGNQERVSNAKSYIIGSVTGLVLTVSSYMILSLINPDLVKFKKIDPITVKNDIPCCQLTAETCALLSSDACTKQGGTSKGTNTSCNYQFGKGICEESTEARTACKGKAEFAPCATSYIKQGWCDAYGGECKGCLTDLSECHGDRGNTPVCCSGYCAWLSGKCSISSCKLHKGDDCSIADQCCCNAGEEAVCRGNKCDCVPDWYDVVP